MNLFLFFSRKYRWSEHYFSVWSLGNTQKLLTTNGFLVSTIFFTIMNVSFLSLRFDLFLVIAKKVNQIRNNVENKTRIISCFAVHLLRVVAMLFNIYFCKLKEIGVHDISRLCYFLWLWLQLIQKLWQPRSVKLV